MEECRRSGGHRREARIALFVYMLFFVALIPATSFGGSAMTDLGVLPGKTESSAALINDAGQVAGWSCDVALCRAFLYRNGVMTDLGVLPGGTMSHVSGMNEAGQVVGNSRDPALFCHAFLYTNNAMTDLGLLPGGTTSLAWAINDAGQVAGESGGHAFLYSGGALADLGALPGRIYSRAYTVNNTGQSAGDSCDSSNACHAFLYSGGVMTDLGVLPGMKNSHAVGINDAGQVVGKSCDIFNNCHAFLYNNGVMTDLGVLPGMTDSTPTGINDAGQVVGNSCDSSDICRAFLYSGGVMTDLGVLPGRTTSYAAVINSTGQVAGDSCNASGLCHAFLFSGTMIDLGVLPGRPNSYAAAINSTGQVAGDSCDPSGSCHAFLYSGTNYTLAVTRAGSGSGTVTSDPPGIDCGSACNAIFAEETVVTLTATPDAGSAFGSWSGCTPSGNTCTVTMSKARNVKATFVVPNPMKLTVARVRQNNGDGAISSSPAGIDCGGTCSASYAAGTTVTLTATPAVSSVLTGWSGCIASGNTCTVVMSKAQSVKATFTGPQALTVKNSSANKGAGTVTSDTGGINCTGGSKGVCKASYTYNTQVTLTAAPDAGSSLMSWSVPGCTGTTCAVTMSKAQTVKATFAGPQALTVKNSSVNKGAGTVTSDTGGINCTGGSKGVCKASYTYNTQVTLTAAPDAGSSLMSWSGCIASGNTCTVVMSKAQSVTAKFRKGP